MLARRLRSPVGKTIEAFHPEGGGPPSRRSISKNHQCEDAIPNAAPPLPARAAAPSFLKTPVRLGLLWMFFVSFLSWGGGGCFSHPLSLSTTTTRLSQSFPKFFCCVSPEVLANNSGEADAHTQITAWGRTAGARSDLLGVIIFARGPKRKKQTKNELPLLDDPSRHQNGVDGPTATGPN